MGMIELLEQYYKEKNAPRELSIYMQRHRARLIDLSLAKGAKTRNKLIDIAIEEFKRRGYRLTRIKDIERAAGHPNVSIVYYYFGTKKQLYDEIKDLIPEEETA